ncbi:hypothetical protein DdX_16949 [Ditylenchus destructor]|uniref:Uncharacterized protein n=1 Tax=Ditylenchus destructor TaxID=166010 RepID=A0AAD4MN23_9BILA|nr:hypothetical protein DdX_16949 [Ditylenchus destructor]
MASAVPRPCIGQAEVIRCTAEAIRCNYTYKWDSHKSNYSLRTHLQHNHKEVFQKLVELEKSATKQNHFTGSKQLSLTQCFNAEEKQLVATTVKRKHSNEMSEQPRVDKMLKLLFSVGDVSFPDGTGAPPPDGPCTPLPDVPFAPPPNGPCGFSPGSSHETRSMHSLGATV